MATKTSASEEPKKSEGGKAGKGARTDGIHAPVTPSKELAEIVGAKALPRSEVVSKMWDYIKTNKLQNPDDGREILADDKLQPLFGKKKVSMFELNKVISAHVTK